MTPAAPARNNPPRKRRARHNRCDRAHAVRPARGCAAYPAAPARGPIRPCRRGRRGREGGRRQQRRSAAGAVGPRPRLRPLRLRAGHPADVCGRRARPPDMRRLRGGIGQCPHDLPDLRTGDGVARRPRLGRALARAPLRFWPLIEVRQPADALTACRSARTSASSTTSRGSTGSTIALPGAGADTAGRARRLPASHQALAAHLQASAAPGRASRIALLGADRGSKQRWPRQSPPAWAADLSPVVRIAAAEAELDALRGYGPRESDAAVRPVPRLPRLRDGGPDRPAGSEDPKPRQAGRRTDFHRFTRSDAGARGRLP